MSSFLTAFSPLSPFGRTNGARYSTDAVARAKRVLDRGARRTRRKPGPVSAPHPLVAKTKLNLLIPRRTVPVEHVGQHLPAIKVNPRFKIDDHELVRIELIRNGQYFSRDLPLRHRYRVMRFMKECAQNEATKHVGFDAISRLRAYAYDVQKSHLRAFLDGLMRNSKHTRVADLHKAYMYLYERLKQSNLPLETLSLLQLMRADGLVPSLKMVNELLQMMVQVAKQHHFARAGTPFDPVLPVIELLNGTKVGPNADTMKLLRSYCLEVIQNFHQGTIKLMPCYSYAVVKYTPLWMHLIGRIEQSEALQGPDAGSSVTGLVYQMVLRSSSAHRIHGPAQEILPEIIRQPMSHEDVNQWMKICNSIAFNGDIPLAINCANLTFDAKIDITTKHVASFAEYVLQASRQTGLYDAGPILVHLLGVHRLECSHKILRRHLSALIDCDVAHALDFFDALHIVYGRYDAWRFVKKDAVMKLAAASLRRGNIAQTLDIVTSYNSAPNRRLVAQEVVHNIEMQIASYLCTSGSVDDGMLVWNWMATNRLQGKRRLMAAMYSVLAPSNEAHPVPEKIWTQWLTNCKNLNDDTVADFICPLVSLKHGMGPATRDLARKMFHYFKRPIVPVRIDFDRVLGKLLVRVYQIESAAGNTDGLPHHLLRMHTDLRNIWQLALPAANPEPFTDTSRVSHITRPRSMRSSGAGYSLEVNAAGMHTLSSEASLVLHHASSDHATWHDLNSTTALVFVMGKCQSLGNVWKQFQNVSQWIYDDKLSIAVANALAEVGDVDSILAIRESLKKHLTKTKSSQMDGILLKAYKTSGRWAEALTWFKAKHAASLTPTDDQYSMMYHALADALNENARSSYIANDIARVRNDCTTEIFVNEVSLSIFARNIFLTRTASEMVHFHDVVQKLGLHRHKNYLSAFIYHAARFAAGDATDREDQGAYPLIRFGALVSPSVEKSLTHEFSPDFFTETHASSMKECLPYFLEKAEEKKFVQFSHNLPYFIGRMERMQKVQTQHSKPKDAKMVCVMTRPPKLADGSQALWSQAEQAFSLLASGQTETRGGHAIPVPLRVDERACQGMLKMYSGLRRADKATTLWNELPLMGIRPSLALHLVYATALARDHDGSDSEAAVIDAIMDLPPRPASSGSVSRLLHALIDAGDWANAWRVYRRSDDWKCTLDSHTLERLGIRSAAEECSSVAKRI